MKVCRICMSKDDQLFPISSNGLYSLYAQLTGVHNLPEDVDKLLPQWVCEECGLRLMSYDKLRQKSLRAHQVLCQLLERVTYITEEEELDQIDRQYNEPESHVDAPLSIDLDNDLIQDKDTREQSKTHWEDTEKKNNPQSTVSNAVSDYRQRQEEQKDSTKLDNTILTDGQDIPKPIEWTSQKSNISLEAIVSNTLMDDEIIQEDSSELDETILGNCFDNPGPNQCNSEQNNNGLESDVSNTVIDDDIIEEESTVSLDPYSTMLEDGLDDCEPSETQLDTVHNQELDTTNNNRKPNKILEFIINLETGESPSVFKSNNDSLIKILSETAVSDTEKDSELVNGYNFDVPLSIFKDNNTLDLLPLKSKNENENFNMKQVIDSLQKLPQIKVKKVGVKKKVVKQKMNRQKVDKKKVDKQKVDKQKVDKQKIDKQNVDKQKIDKQNVDKQKIDKQNVDKQKVDKQKVDKQEVDKEKLDNKLLFDKLINIRTLSLEEQIAEFKQRKYSRNYTASPYKCNVCYTGFATERSLARHNFIHSEKWGDNECKICKRRFPTMTCYNAHMESHKNIYSCIDCPFTSRHRINAVRHINKHEGKVYKCSDCNLEFTSTSSLSYHCRLKHVSKFACKYCGFSYVGAHGLNRHILVGHRFEKKKQASEDDPTCVTCNIKFVSAKALNTHLGVAHPDKTSLKKVSNIGDTYKTKNGIVCDICGVKMAQGKAYYQHYKRNHPSQSIPAEQFICEECGKVFKTRYHQQRHSAVHSTLKPYECDECGRKFNAKSSIRTHILNLHLQQIPKPNYSYTCNICGKILRSVTGRLNHELMHSGGGGVYPCTICGNLYNRPASVKRHMMIVHSGHRQFVCDDCGKSFTAKHKMKEHIERLHMNVRRPAKAGARRRRNGHKTSAKPIKKTTINGN